MIDEHHPVILSTFLGTLFTWGMTAVGALFVFFVQKPNRLLFDICLGFAAGVMVAASLWCVLLPAFDLAEEADIYGRFAFVPLTIGFIVGGIFLIVTDFLLHAFHVTSLFRKERLSVIDIGEKKESIVDSLKNISKLKMLMLVIAITVHNIPEALAVGIAFGAVGKTESATFENARSLVIGLGIHNIPEGLTVSLPLRSMGMASWKAFLCGQFCGLLEPVFGILGCLLVTVVDPILPYAMAFSAGAMMWVVFDDLIPEGSSSGNSKWCSIAAMTGFTFMMIVELGFHNHEHISHDHHDEILLNATMSP